MTKPPRTTYDEAPQELRTGHPRVPESDGAGAGQSSDSSDDDIPLQDLVQPGTVAAPVMESSLGIPALSDIFATRRLKCVRLRA